jgi:type II secretory pathway pseudopilin PulG
MKKLPVMAAFSLVELTLAIGIAALCLVTVFALVPIAVLTNRNSTSQTAATNIAALAVADLRAATAAKQTGSSMLTLSIPTDPTSPPQFLPPNFVPCSGGQTSSASQVRYFWDSLGLPSSSFSSTSLYRLIVTFVKNTGTTGALYVNVKVTWPAAIDPCAVTPAGSVEMFAALDRN